MIKEREREKERRFFSHFYCHHDVAQEKEKVRKFPVKLIHLKMKNKNNCKFVNIYSNHELNFIIYKLL